MTLNEQVRVGLSGVAMNKVRAGLTMLGVVIGLAAVITQSPPSVLSDRSSICPR